MQTIMDEAHDQHDDIQGIVSETSSQSHNTRISETIMDEALEQHDIQGDALETSSQSYDTGISENISEVYNHDSIPAEETSTDHYLVDKNMNTDIDSESWQSVEQTIQSQQEMITMLITNLKVRSNAFSCTKARK